MLQFISYNLILYAFLLLPYVITSPLPLADSAYGKFLTFLKESNCKTPENVKFPFSNGTSQNFDYLSSPLNECKTAEALREDEEVYLLCKEVFEALINITCAEYSSPMKINSTIFSVDICTDFQNLQNILPKRNDYLAGKLVDRAMCKVFCSHKFESLCKVLLWSYDIQAKIQSSLTNKVLEAGGNEPKNLDLTKDTPNAASLTPEENNPLPNVNEIDDKQINLKTSTEMDAANAVPLPEGTLPIENDLKSSTKSNITPVMITPLNKTTAPVNQDSQSLKNNQSDITAASLENDKTLPENTMKQNPNLESSNEIDVTSKLKSQNVNASNKQNQTLMEVKPAGKLNSNLNIGANITKIKYQNISTSADSLPQNKITNVEHNQTDSEVKNDVKTVVESNDNKYQEKGESKIQTNSVTSTAKDKLTKDVTQKALIEVTSDNAKVLEEISTLQNVDKADDIESQDEKEQELYNDTENDADYAKSDFESPFNPPSRNKDPEFKSVVNVVNDLNGNDIASSYDGFFISRNNMGRGSDDSIQVIPSFPEQEDSHFFFYFLTIVLVLMAGYLIFHNKQKIIALIVEGRHERRRRSHGAGYKKLETK